jgi:BirA family transcriptional regulator, biotin operon repressor / biotin---[acetyl-CoA-carboxylase] ligase
VDTLDRLTIESLADGRFHSGTEIAERLGISRTAVWKHVQRLERFGLVVASLPGKGYRLSRPIDLLHQGRIREEMPVETSEHLACLSIENTLDSTNSALMKRASEGAVSGTALLSEFQTQGRGRIGRSWLAPFGGGLCLSLLWRFQDPRQVAGLSLAVGVALSRALVELGVEGLALKWPNDLLWGGAKLGGILIEIAGEAHGSCAVVIGVGLNIDLPPEIEKKIDQSATDLSRVLSGHSVGRNRVAARFLSHLILMLKDYAQDGLKPYLDEWRSLHRDAGRDAVVHIGEQEIPGRIVNVSDEGYLLFETRDGVLKTFASGEVRLRINA